MDHSRLAAGKGRRSPRAGTLKRGLQAVSTLAFALAALTLGGCHVKSKYKPLAADSTAVAPDSIGATMTSAQQLWDAGSGEDAARLSAGAMLADFKMRTQPEWADRAKALLDSLAIGGEVGSGGGAVLVNFFSRADPERGSWPYLFWTGTKGPRMQQLEGRDLNYLAMATLPASGTPAQLFVLFARRAAAGGQPLSMAWKAGAGGAYSLLQTLGPDSLGGSGGGEFVMNADSTLELHTRTFRPVRMFDECPTCPHLYGSHVFRWIGSSFVRVSDEASESPYATFVRFVQAVAANDKDAAREECTDGDLWDQARHFEWDRPKGNWRVAPSTDETAHEMIFFRGSQEAYRVLFEARDGAWKISDIQPTRQSVE